MRIIQNNRKLEKENERLKKDMKYLKLDMKELMMQLKKMKDMVFKKVSKRKWLPWQKDDDDEYEKDKKPKKPYHKSFQKNSFTFKQIASSPPPGAPRKDDSGLNQLPCAILLQKLTTFVRNKKGSKIIGMLIYVMVR